MKKLLLATLSLSLLTAARAQFNSGDLAVLRVGDGSTVLANTGDPISILDVSSAGSVQSTVSIPSTQLEISGVATSEGQLDLNADGQSFTVAGYVPPFGGSGSLSGRSSANAPRGYVTVGLNGSVSATTTLAGTYSAQNIRSGVATSGGTYFAGSGTSATAGILFYNGTTISSIQGVNARVLGEYGGSLYYSSGASSGTGIYKYSGLPTSASTATPVLSGVANQGTSPYDFVLSPDGQTLYVADENIGIQKFSLISGAWTWDYNFADGQNANAAYGLAVDFSKTDPIVYWTSTNALWAVTDNGAGGTGTSILSSGNDYNFRGLELIPTPEPSTCALGALGLASVGFLVRRKRG